MKSDLKTVDVWLDVGKQGRCFTYLDANCLGVEIGDVVLVRLKGRATQGIVVKIGSLSDQYSIDSSLKGVGQIKYQNIEALIEPSAVSSDWRDWIEAVARSCYTSPFKMLKAAMPPGWLGYRRKANLNGKSFWWISLAKNPISGKKLSTRQKELEQHLIRLGGGIWRKNLEKYGFSSYIIERLILSGRATKERRICIAESKQRPLEQQFDLKQIESPILTQEQKNSIKIFSSLPPGGGMLLWGVTGSGKTEVYLQLVSESINERKSSLILAPEIGLIPQLVDRFRSRFGARVLEYHSGCSDKERIQTWREIRNNSEPLIVVGTRSAVFLPLNRLGLIVLDEEHDSSYKQESPMPCYDARILALDRVERSGAKVVLGSATPSLRTWKQLKPEGCLSLSRLTSRISERSLPSVHIVDMRREFESGHRSLFSRYLMQQISCLPAKGHQAVVLVPRRGYSPFLSCRSCGEVVECPNCDVALTLHKGKKGEEFLRCHWCDYRSGFGSNCNHCGSSAFKPFGAGTQRVLEKLMEELQGLRVLRFDRDTTGGRDGHRRLLEKFAEGEADVLIGTQMLAKGMDLPNVTLAAVLAADGLLHRPDLQAEEQSLQLFLQLAGRSGRGEFPGQVIIQTYCPDHPVISHLKDGSYQDFLEKESKLRRQAGLIPYSRACLIRLSGESPSLTASTSAALAKRLKPICDSSGWILVGPAPALVSRVAGKTRWQILLHGPEASSLPLPQDCLSLWEELPKGISLSVDPDPLHM